MAGSGSRKRGRSRGGGAGRNTRSKREKGGGDQDGLHSESEKKNLGELADPVELIELVEAGKSVDEPNSGKPVELEDLGEQVTDKNLDPAEKPSPTGTPNAQEELEPLRPTAALDGSELMPLNVKKQKKKKMKQVDPLVKLTGQEKMKKLVPPDACKDNELELLSHTPPPADLSNALVSSASAVALAPPSQVAVNTACSAPTDQSTPAEKVPLTIMTEMGTASLHKRDEGNFYSLQCQQGGKWKKSYNTCSGSSNAGPATSGSSGTGSNSKGKGQQRKYTHAEFHAMEATAESKWGKKKEEHWQINFEPGTIQDRFKQFLGRFIKAKRSMCSNSWPTPNTQSQILEHAVIARAEHEDSYYKKLVKFMVSERDFCLEVDFEHIMEDDIELAVAMVQKSTHQDLESAARSFMMDQVPITMKEQVNWEMTLRFANKPDSLIPVTELLTDPDAALRRFPNMLDVGDTGNTLSDLVMAMFGGYAEYIFDTHRQYKKSWRGEFNISHLFVIDKWRYVIIKKPEFVLEGDEDVQFFAQKHDLQKLPEIFTPFLDCRKPEDRSEGQPPQDSDLPVFYPELCSEINNATREDLNQPWFPDYIVHFPALKPPIARHDFVSDAYLALKKDSLPWPLHSVVLSTPGTNRKDWRYTPNLQIEVLRKVYDYKKQQNASTSSGSQGKEPFSENTRGIISYDRHLRHHASDTAKVDSIAEVDVFASSKLSVYLHLFLKMMLSGNLMKEGDFNDIWLQYRSARVRTTDGSELKQGRRLSCWM